MSTWSSSVKRLLYNLGYNNLWNNSNLNINYIPTLKQILRDQYLQVWNNKIMNQSKLYYYRKFEFKYEKYLDVVTNENNFSF